MEGLDGFSHIPTIPGFVTYKAHQSTFSPSISAVLGASRREYRFHTGHILGREQIYRAVPSSSEDGHPLSPMYRWTTLLDLYYIGTHIIHKTTITATCKLQHDSINKHTGHSLRVQANVTIGRGPTQADKCVPPMESKDQT